MKPQSKNQKETESKSKEEQEKELDEALKESFPASDVPSITQPDHKK